MSRFDGFASACATALLCTLILQIAAQDELYFHSDWLSQASVTLLAAWLLLPMVAVVAWLGCRRGRARVTDLPLGAVVVTLVVLLHASFRPKSGWVEFALVLAMALALALWTIPRLPGREEAARRMLLLSRLVGVLGVVGIIGVAASGLARSESQRPPAPSDRHAILIVIDGLPAQILGPYRPDAPTTGFEELARRGRVFRRARTNKTYTSGFFGTLYTGSLGPAREAARKTPSLLERLHDDGVSARWLAFHSNGIPETSGVTRYPGLRSAFLSERFRWIPSALGLPYHLFLQWGSSRGTLGPRIDALYEATHGPADEDALWSQVVPEQISDLQNRAPRSLLIVHVSSTKHLVQAAAEYGEDGEELRSFYARASASHYRYEPQDEPLMRRIRASYRSRAHSYAERIDALLGELDEAGRLSRTLVIVTADHGSILSRNRIWYGYHPDEEVTRVPLLAFGLGLSGVSERSADTRDLGATLLDHLQVASDSRGTSLLGPDVDHDVPVLTTLSDLRNERFLILYRANEKYVLNVHPRGDGRAWHATVRGWTLGERQGGLPEDTALRSAVSAAACGFGLRPRDIHEAFAPLVEPHACAALAEAERVATRETSR